MKKFLRLRAEKYSYLKDNDDEYKRAKGTKSVLWNDILSSEIIKNVSKHLKLKIK